MSDKQLSKARIWARKADKQIYKVGITLAELGAKIQWALYIPARILLGDYPLKVCVDSGEQMMAYYRVCGKKSYLVFSLDGKKRFLLSFRGLLLNYSEIKLQDGQISKLIKLWGII